MMSNKKAVGTAYIPDMEDWWDDDQTPALPRQNRPRHRAGRIEPAPMPARSARRVDRRKATKHNRMLMYVTLGVLAACLFFQVNRYAQIASQKQPIVQLVNEIEQLETDKTNLELRLSARANINRVREEAMYNLGMDYPSEGQVRVITVGALSPESLSQMTASMVDSAQ